MADFGRSPSSRFRIDFGNVEYVDVQVGVPQFALRNFPVIIAGDDIGWIVHEFSQTLKYIFRVARIGEILDELVVDGEVGRKDEKVLDALFQKEIGDKCPRQSRFPNTCGQSKTERRKCPFKIFTGGVVLVDLFQFGGKECPVAFGFFQFQLVRQFRQDAEAFFLWRAEA